MKWSTPHYQLPKCVPWRRLWFFLDLFGQFTHHRPCHSHHPYHIIRWNCAASLSNKLSMWFFFLNPMVWVVLLIVIFLYEKVDSFIAWGSTIEHHLQEPGKSKGIEIDSVPLRWRRVIWVLGWQIHRDVTWTANLYKSETSGGGCQTFF